MTALRLCLLAGLLFRGQLAIAEVFRVGTFNVENYIDEPSSSRPLKSAAAKAQVCAEILALKPDVLALEEMGSTNALLELQSSLRGRGLDLPYWEHVQGHDTNIHLAVLSRYPIVARRPHTNDTFLLSGRRLRVDRGFAEVEIAVNTNYQFTLIAAHLKSRLPSALADEEEWRLQEAMLLRRIVDERLRENPSARLIVLGDFNDVKDSRAVKTILGHGKSGLFDTRPAEREDGGREGVPAERPARSITWTEYYAKEDVYSRIDYIFISHALERDWLHGETYVLRAPDWGAASDHRPLVAGFVTK